MSYHSYNVGGLGAIEDMGIAPYQVQGDPVKALIAQLNRFANKSVNPGAKCGTRNYLPRGALPLATTVDDKAAATANLIVYDSLNCISDERLLDFRKMKAVNDALAPGATIPWVMANLNDITVRIAQFADSLGLDPATVGITSVDPRVVPPSILRSPIALASIAVVGIGLIYMLTRRK